MSKKVDVTDLTEEELDAVAGGANRFQLLAPETAADNNPNVSDKGVKDPGSEKFVKFVTLEPSGLGAGAPARIE